MEQTHQIEVRDAVEELAKMPEVKNVKPLKNHSSGYRLQVGRYRVLFNWNQGVEIVSINEVKKRDDRTY